MRAVYRLGSACGQHYGEALYVETDEGVVSVTVTAWSAAEAKRMADRVVKTLRVID